MCVKDKLHVKDTVKDKQVSISKVVIYIYLNNHLQVKVRWNFNKKSTTRLLSQNKTKHKNEKTDGRKHDSYLLLES